MPCEHGFVQEEEAEEFAEALKNEIKEHGEYIVAVKPVSCLAANEWMIWPLFTPKYIALTFVFQSGEPAPLPSKALEYPWPPVSTRQGPPISAVG